MSSTRQQTVQKLQPHLAKFPSDNKIIRDLLASDLVPTWDLHKFRDGAGAFKDTPGGSPKGFVSPDSLVMMYFVRPTSPFVKAQTSAFPDWSDKTVHPYWTWPQHSLPVLEGAILFTPGSEGPPGMAHGGAIATALDTVATCLTNSMFCRMWVTKLGVPNEPAFEHIGYRTVTLTTGYKRGVPVNTVTYYRIQVDKAEDGVLKNGDKALRRKLTIRGGLYDRVLGAGETLEQGKSSCIADFEAIFVLGGLVPEHVFVESWKKMEETDKAKL